MNRVRKKVEIQGVRTGIPFSDYLWMDACSNTDLKNLMRSPAHCVWSWANPDPDTPAKAEGRAVHVAILEPDALKDRVGVLPETFNGRTKEGKALKAQMQSTYDIVLKHDDYQKVIAMRDEVYRNPMAARYLATGGPIEATVTAYDPIGDMMCKSRPDKIATTERVLIDLKKTVKTSVRAFHRQAFDLGYFRQLAYYRMQLRWLAEAGVLKRDVPDLVAFLVVCESGSHENALVPVDEEILRVEEQRLRPLLDRYSDCLHNNRWPGWDPIAQADMDGWIRRKYENDEE